MIALNQPATIIDRPATTPSESPVREGVLEIPGALRLHFGGQLDGVRVAWRLVGDHGPVVAALGGISAGRFVTGTTLHVDGGNHAAGGWHRAPDGSWRT